MKMIKKIWLICLWISSLALAGCFHIPDKDWLPSKNKAKTEEVKKNVEVEQAVNSFMDWINMISSEKGEVKNDENNAFTGGKNDTILSGNENYTWSDIIE